MFHNKQMQNGFNAKIMNTYKKFVNMISLNENWLCLFVLNTVYF